VTDPGAPVGAGHVTIELRPTTQNGPAPKRVSVPTGVTVFDGASWNGFAIDSTCGGHGTCRKCRVRVASGPSPAGPLDVRAFSAEEVRHGWRLACRATVTGDLVVEVPPLATRPKAATVGVGRQVILRPAVQKRLLEIDEPSLADQRTDLERLLAALTDLEPAVDLDVVRLLPAVLRGGGFRVTAVVVGDRLIDVEPGDTTEHRYGIAVDLGTTTAVATLLDLGTGTPLAVRSMLNLQQSFGADVISRISAVMLDPTALGRLRDLAHETLATLTREVCEEAGVEPGHVYEVALAGNATMVHLALGIDPESLGVAPFVLAARRFDGVTAADLGMGVHPRAPAVVLPALGAYVGGDVIGGALASGMDRDSRVRLFVDVGTNCEVVLADGARLLATAAPAGPAFEAASIRCGMRAAPGAIETVGLVDGRLRIGTIGDEPAVGLCGSGLVDACAVLVTAGLLDSSGRFRSSDEVAVRAPGIVTRLATLPDSAERVFVLDWGPAGHPEPGGAAPPGSVYLSQRDVRELQFAKAAIATGWALLLAELGLAESEVSQVLLAGSFGSYLSPASAVRIGLVPALPVTRIVSAGNVAGEGAKMALLSTAERHAADTLLREIRYVELSDRPDFNDLFVDRLGFPP
jgi:uncharacterized 2Fe-2S/4Fe-4S cluster protein (DUF4445 family)